MTKDEAREILKHHNLWRRNQDDVNPYEMCDPKELGIAIDCAIEALEQPAFNRLTNEQVEEIIAKCVKPIDHGLHWDFKKMYEDLFEAITGEKHGS
jgi:glutamate/tyrosine decarboxylase-like PLP-dependent enzyme